MILILLILIAALFCAITWNGSGDKEKEIHDIQGYLSFPALKDRSLKVKVEGLAPLTCKCCGGEIDGETLICKYCGTKYMIKKESL